MHHYLKSYDAVKLGVDKEVDFQSVGVNRGRVCLFPKRLPRLVPNIMFAKSESWFPGRGS